MPIGSGIVYNTGDLILNQVSSSGTAFLETKISASANSLIYFDSTARINSASLNSITVGTASYVSGSNGIVTNFTASNISASGTGSFAVVGIGSSTPTTKLDVRGQVFINNVAVNTALNQLTLNLNGTNYAQFYDLGTSANTLVLGGSPLITTLPTASISASLMSWAMNSGYVGVGTTSPTNKLDVIGGNINTDGEIYSLGGRLSLYRSAGSSYIDWSSGQNLSFRTETTVGGGSASEKMRIDSSGNVGIGTTSPNTKFEVSGSDASTIQAIFQSSTGAAVAYNGGIQLGNGSSNQNSQIYHDSSGDNTLTFKSNYGGGTDNKFIFSPGGTEKVRFQQNGRVGIGTSGPSSSLHVRNSNSGDQTLLVLEHSAGYLAGTENRLDFYDDEVHKVAARIAQYYTGDAGNRWGLKFYTNSSTAINSIPALTLMGNNNVGIGTTSPGALLELTGSSNSSLLNIKSPSSSTILYVSGSGAVGVGTSAYTGIGGNGYLMLKNVLCFVSDNTANSNNRNWSIGTNGQFNGDLYFVTSADSSSFPNDAYRISFTRAGDIITNGSIGIGTTIPINKLQVNGNVSGSSFTSSISNAVGFLGTSSYATNAISAISAISASYLVPTNNYYVSNLTASGQIGVGTTTIASAGGKFQVYDNNVPSNSVRAGLFQCGTGTLSFTGANPRGNGLIVNVTDNTNVILPIGGDYDIIGVIGSVKSSVSGYNTTGVYGHVSSSDAGTSFFAAYGLRADAYATGSNSKAYGLYIGSVKGAANNYGIYVNDTAANNYIGGNLTVNGTFAPTNLSASGNISTSFANIGGVTYNESIQFDQFDYFQLQPYVEAGQFPSNVLSKSGGTTPTFTTYISSSTPFSKVLYNTSYYEAIGDYIPINAGEILYGEVWAMRETGATGTAGVLYCGIARYDKDKKQLDANLGLTYFIADNITVPATSTWTKYSGTTTLPLTHTPYNGSDGGPARYIRPYIIVNYPAGTVPTYWSSWKIRKVQLTRDTGIVSITGSLGIGTTTPSAKLNIASTSQTTKAIIQSLSTGSGLGGYLAFNPGGDSTYSKVAIGVYDNYYSSYNRGNIAFMINSAADATEVGFTDTKMYISASGNVGIGRTSLGAKLDVQGTTSDNSAYAFWTRNSSGNVIQYVRNDGQFLVGNGTTDNFVINSSGNVGIGTTLPSDKLHVYSTSDSLVRIQCGDGYEAGIWFYEDASPKWEIYKRSGTDDLNFYSSDLNKSVFTLATAGGVGIGTVSPGAELEISSSTASKLLNIKGAAGTGILFVSGSGKVGINTSSPAAPLDVVGSAATTILRNTSASSYGGLRIYNDQNNIFRALEIDYAGSSYASSLITNAPTGEAASIATTGAYPLVLGTSNTARMTITSGGDVGVGTNSPTQKLEVAGYSMAGIDDYRTSIYGNSSGASISFGTTSSLASLGRIGAYGSLFNINSLNGDISFQSSSIEKMRLTTTGYLGIGTSNPVSLLSVQGDINSNYNSSGTSRIWRTFSTNHAAGNRGATVLFGMYDGSPAGMNVVNTSSSNPSYNSQYIAFLTHEGAVNADERMRITPLGNVGIGTINPVYLFDVNGSSRFGYTSSNTHQFTGSISIYPTGSSIDFSTTGLPNTTTAKIFVGKSPNPAGSLTSTLVSGYGQDDYGLILQSNVSGDCGGIKVTDDGVVIWGAADDDLIRIVDEDNNLLRFVIDNVGNVGIGTTTPGSLLEISSSTYSNLFRIKGAGGDGILYVSGSGNIGIGTTSPGAKLEITGSSNSALLNIKSPISGAILYVSGSGAVGIGDSNVGTYRLYVSGSFGATTKSFIIDHPTKAGKKLIYGSLESPYHGIRLTGRDTLVNGKCKVELPEYIYKLILHDSVNIQLTGIKCNKTLYVDEINIPENYFTIAYDKAIFESYKDYDFFWDFTAIRADVPELITEL